MYTPTRPSFTDAAGVVVNRYTLALDAPPSGETDGPVRTLRHTPRVAGERLTAAAVGGPAARCRVDVSFDGGATRHDASAGVALPGSPGVGAVYTILLYPVALAFAGDDSG